MILIPIIAALGLSACGASNTAAPTSDPSVVKIAAAENFWGSIAKQLGGTHAQTVSIITNPDTDPHDYDATAADARTMAQAQLAIVNGIGYDPWAEKLLAASPDKTRRVIDVGDVVGLKAGDNPHRWYSPGDVQEVVTSITDRLKALDPKDASYFDTQKATFLGPSLARYNGLIGDIKTKYTATPVGATESIFSPLAQALGLKLLTPPHFLEAISEGDDPTTADKTTADAQIADKQIKVLVFNSQNATPDVQLLVNEANKVHIPVVPVTETLSPAGASFQDWQSNQLQALDSALAQATAG